MLTKNHTFWHCSNNNNSLSESSYNYFLVTTAAIADNIEPWTPRAIKEQCFQSEPQLETSI